MFYESPHRLSKTLLKLSKLVPEERILFIGRELSKKFEGVYLLKPSKIAEWLENANNLKGEFVLMLSGGASQKNAVSSQAEPSRLASLLGAHMSSKDIATTLSSTFGLNKNEAYQIALSCKEKG
jgi:16S rRNA (cytidine1402-2'-O)-methyltransferase